MTRAKINLILAITTAAAIGMGSAHGATGSGHSQYRNSSQSGHGPGSAAYHGQRHYQGNRYGSPSAAHHPHYSAGTIKKYAKAHKAVEKIGRQVSRKIKGTHNTKEMQKVRRATQKRMIQAVKQSGLSIPKYNAITHAMMSDAQLRKRIQQMTN